MQAISIFKSQVGLWRFFLTVLFLIVPMASHAAAEPDYQVVQRIGDIEIRDYSAYAVAEVVVEGPADQAGNRAFPILAAYIFGKNMGARP